MGGDEPPPLGEPHSAPPCRCRALGRSGNLLCELVGRGGRPRPTLSSFPRARGIHEIHRASPQGLYLDLEFWPRLFLVKWVPPSGGQRRSRGGLRLPGSPRRPEVVLVNLIPTLTGPPDCWHPSSWVYKRSASGPLM